MIKDYQLMLMVLFLLFLDFAILIAWQIVDPMMRETKELPPEVGESVPARSLAAGTNGARFA